MKKNLFLLAIGLILFVGIVSSLTPTYMKTAVAAYYINVSFVSQTPDPVEPGQFVELRFKIENWGADTAEDVAVEILLKYPFSLIDEEAIKNIGSLQGRQTGKTGVIVKYRLKVDEKAVEGENEVELRYKVNQQQHTTWVKVDPFTVDVQTHDAIIAIESVESEPKEFAPGQLGILTIKIRNIADSVLKEIKVKLDLQKTTTVTSAVATTEYPFSPIGSANEKTLAKLEAGEINSLEFNLVADPDAEANVYKVPLLIYYSDELGKNYSKDLIIGLIIGEKPDLAINLKESTIISSGMKGTVTLKLINKGTNNIKFSYVTLKESEDYKILSPQSVYVGNIDSDDYETVNFDLYVDSKKSEIALPLTVEYKDANNKNYKETVEIPLKLYSASEAKRYGIKKGDGKVGTFIVVLIVGGGLFLYWRWRKKKKLKK